MIKSFELVVPHRAPMLLLSRIVSVSEKECVCEVDVDEQNLFATSDGLPSWVGSEFMAQAIAAYGGSQTSNDSDSRIGFLIGIRKYRSEVSYFNFGKTVSVRVGPVMIDQDVGSYAGKIYCDDRLIAEGSLTILKPSKQKLEKMRLE